MGEQLLVTDQTTRRHSRTEIRPEIQVLRAVAVLMVVVFHLWPTKLPGGYAGVDVFFVVSGFLITAHLMREVDRTGSIRLREFWARRARRLLPAALLVLLVTAVGVFFFVPSTFWNGFFRNIAASTLYIGNWQLAFDSVDYLAADAEASPAQHYWSLSVEEQFYLVWPLVILLAVMLVGRAAGIRRYVAIALTLGLVTVASFVYSIVFTSSDPSFAYFFTPIRAWEFGAGGLLALVPALRGRNVARIGISLVGIALLAVSAFVLQPDTPFPGYAAALPVVGTLLVIFAGTPDGWYGRLLGFRPVQWLGDISYSTYLWHWPIIVIGLFALDVSWLSATQKVVMLAATIVLAWLTKQFVEDPVRRGRLARAKSWKTYVATLVGMALVVAPAAGGIVAIQLERDRAAAQWAESAEDPCFGAPALDPDVRAACADDPGLDGVLLPPPASSGEDTPVIWDMSCRLATWDPQVRDCHYPPGGEIRTTLAIVGDSHMAQWFPAIEPIADANGWDMHIYWKAGCPFNANPLYHDNPEFVEACTLWNTDIFPALEELAPDVLLTSGQTLIGTQGPDGERSREAAIEGYAEQWQRVVDLGIKLVVLQDTPRVLKEQLACAADPADLVYDCVRDQKDALVRHDGILTGAAELVPEATFLDFTDAFCIDGECPSVLGHVIVYRDASSHFTSTFGATLTSVIGDRLVAAISG